MSIGVSYREALEMPLDMAIALLIPYKDERRQNTRPEPIVQKPAGRKLIASKFKNAKS